MKHIKSRPLKTYCNWQCSTIGQPTTTRVIVLNVNKPFLSKVSGVSRIELIDSEVLFACLLFDEYKYTNYLSCFLRLVNCD